MTRVQIPYIEKNEVNDTRAYVRVFSYREIFTLNRFFEQVIKPYRSWHQYYDEEFINNLEVTLMYDNDVINVLEEIRDSIQSGTSSGGGFSGQTADDLVEAVRDLDSRDLFEFVQQLTDEARSDFRGVLRDSVVNGVDEIIESPVEVGDTLLDAVIGSSQAMVGLLNAVQLQKISRSLECLCSSSGPEQIRGYQYAKDGNKKQGKEKGGQRISFLHQVTGDPFASNRVATGFLWPSATNAGYLYRLSVDVFDIDGDWVDDDRDYEVFIKLRVSVDGVDYHGLVFNSDLFYDALGYDGQMVAGGLSSSAIIDASEFNRQMRQMLVSKGLGAFVEENPAFDVNLEVEVITNSLDDSNPAPFRGVGHDVRIERIAYNPALLDE